MMISRRTALMTAHTIDCRRRVHRGRHGATADGRGRSVIEQSWPWGYQMPTDDETTVQRLLDAMGIAPPSDEVDAMVTSYPALRAAADSLYAPEASRFV